MDAASRIGSTHAFTVTSLATQRAAINNRELFPAPFEGKLEDVKILSVLLPFNRVKRVPAAVPHLP